MGLLATAGIAAGAAVAGLGIAAGVSVGLAARFNDEILKVANNTGMSTAQMNEMRASVLKLGAEGPAPLGEIAQGFEKAANAGYHGAEAFKIVHAAMQAAVETGAKVPDVVDTVTAALKNFRLPASDAGLVLGEMMRAAAEGDVRLPDLANNLNKVMVMAGALHLPLNEVLAAFSTLTTYTHNAALSQTVLYGALSHIIAPTKASTTEIEALSKASGVDLVAAYAAVRDHTMDLTGFFGVLREALHKANLTTGQQTAAMYALGGGLRGGLALVSLLSQGWEDYNKRAKDVASSTGLVADQWKRTSDTLGFQLGLLKNQAEEVGIAFGTVLLPPLVKALEFLTGHMPAVTAAVNQFALAFSNLIGPLDGFKSKSDAAGASALDLKRHLGDVPPAAREIGSSGSFLDQFAASLDRASGHGKTFQTDLQEVERSVSTTLAALGTDAQSVEKSVSSTFNSLGMDSKTLAAVLAQTVNTIGIVFGTMAQQVADAIKTTADDIAGGFKVVGDLIQGFVREIRDTGTLLHDLITGQWGKIVGDVKTIFGDVLRQGQKLVSDMLHLFGTLTVDIIRQFNDLLNGVLRIFGLMPVDLLQIAHDAFNGVMGAVGAFAGNMTAGASNVVQGFVSGLRAIISESLGVVQQMVSAVIGAVSGLAGAMFSAGANAAGSFASGLASMAGAVAGAAGGLLGSVTGLLGFKSPNKKGDDPFKWGKSVGQNFAAGLSSEGAAVAAAADSILQQLRGKLGNVSIGPGGVGLGAEFAQLTAEMKRLPPDFQAAGDAIVKGYVQKVDAAEEKYNRARQAAIDKFLAQEKVELELHPKQFGAWVTQHTQSLKDHLEKLKSTLSEHVANLKKQIDAMKSPAGLWDGLKKQIDKVSNDDFKALSLAILEGKGNIHGLAVEAANAQENAKRMGEAEDKAAIKIDKASGNVADAFDRLSKITSGELSAAESKYAFDLIHHTGNLAKDTAAIEKHSGTVTRDSDALAKAADVAKFTTDAIHALGSASFSAGRALGVVLTPTVNTLTTAAKSTTDAFTVLADTANKTLKDAEDQYALDLINHTGNLIADTQAIISAKDAVNGFSSALNAATAIADAVGAAAPVTAATAAAAAAAVTSSGPGYTVTVNPDGSVVTQQTSAVSTSPASSSNEPIFSTGSGTDKIAESIATVADKVQAVADNTATIATKQQTQIDQNAAELAELRQQNDWLTFNNDTLKELLGLAQAGVKGDVSSTQGLKKYKQRVQAHRAFHR